MTEEEKKELEALRREKRQRAQQSRAQAALEAAGVPASFAPLLAGMDDGDTDKRAKAFCSVYQAALQEDVKKRLPQSAPVVEAPAPRRAERGVRRIR